VGVFEYSCIEVGKSRSNIHVLGWAKVCCACIGVDDCVHHDDDFFWVLLCVYVLHADDDDSFCRVDARGCDDGGEDGSTERGRMEVKVCVWVSGCVYERTTIFVSALCR